MPTTMMPRRALIVAFGASLLLCGAGCGDDDVVRYRPPFEVVDGTPAVDTGLPSIDDQQPQVNPDDFANNAPIQVDVFFQKTVRKVDILWVVDNSCSMVQEQQKLASNFQFFITDLASADPPVDYHLGIITTDATGEGGELRPIATNSSLRYIACNENGSNACSPQDPVTAFSQTVAVGTGGGVLEKGLLAAHLALSEPMRSTKNAGFLRDDAALYVIIVSDEGDASCAPLIPQPSNTTDLTQCNFTPFCRCGDTSTGYGSVDYYVRFFEGLKGYGNDDLVAVAAIVSTQQTRIQQYGATWLGCDAGAAGTAFYAPRYVEVAQRTGGITTSICDPNYQSALSALGFAVSGQRTDFPLSRRPIDPSMVPIKVFVQEDPFDPSTKREVPQAQAPGGDGWAWVKCESGSFLNVIRFGGSWVPPPKARITVNYQVDVGSGRACN